MQFQVISVKHFSLIQGLFDIDVNGIINPMEKKFPKCLSCPVLNNRLPKGSEVVDAWSRDVLSHDLQSSDWHEMYIPDSSDSFINN